MVNPIVPKPPDLVSKIPIFDKLSPSAISLLSDWLNDPVSLLVSTTIFFLVIAYLVVDVAQNWQSTDFKNGTDEVTPGDREVCSNKFYYPKFGILLAIIFVSVFVSTLSVVFLRHVSDISRFAHDGGILMTEQAMKWLTEGKNVYVESFVGTPMEANFPSEPSLTHFPYLPWVFLFPLPFYVASNALFGWFDMRFIYLLLLGVMVLMAPGMAGNRTEKLILASIFGLNPIMANDIIYGQNDVFIVFWMVLSIYLLVKRRERLALLAMGLAMASKFTAWFILPFFLLYLCQVPLTAPVRLIVTSLRKLSLMVIAALPAILPFALWDFYGMYEDVWLFNIGASQSPVLIKGIGFANVVLALGWVSDKSGSFPFWIPEIFFGLPIFVLLLWWQQRDNTLKRALMAFGVFFFMMIYFSRTMNPNYIGFAIPFFAMGYLLKEETSPPELYKPEVDAVSYENASVGRT